MERCRSFFPAHLRSLAIVAVVALLLAVVFGWHLSRSATESGLTDRVDALPEQPVDPARLVLLEHSLEALERRADRLAVNASALTRSQLRPPTVALRERLERLEPPVSLLDPQNPRALPTLSDSAPPAVPAPVLRRYSEQTGISEATVEELMRR
jgi:hypothetical protein